MAHKKGGGSTRNGRDSNAQRLGVKVFSRALSLFVSAVPHSMPVKMSVWAVTTLCLLKLPVRSSSLFTDV